MTRPALTPSQNRVFDFIRSHIRDQQTPPTLAEIGAALSLRSTNGVHKLVLALEQKGYITRTPMVSRGISLAESDDPFTLTEAPPLLPIVGKVRSDRPDQLRRNPAGALVVDPRFLGRAGAASCIIAISGDDGMLELGIRRSDLLLVEETDWQQLLNGELSAAIIGERIIARRFDFARNRFHLRSSARGYTEESFRADSPGCHIIGRVLSVMRKL